MKQNLGYNEAVKMEVTC